MNGISLLIYLLCIGAAFGYSTQHIKNVKDAYCNATLAAEDAVEIEHQAYLKYTEKKIFENNKVFIKSNHTLHYLMPELAFLLEEVKKSVVQKKTALVAQLNAYEADPSVLNAANAKDQLELYVQTVTNSVDNLKAKLALIYEGFIVTHTNIMSEILSGLEQDLAIIVAVIEQNVLDGVTNAASCACETLRNFVRFTMNQHSLQAACSRNAVESLQELQKTLEQMIRAFRRSALSPMIALSCCLAHTATETTAETKLLLNICLGVNYEQFIVYSEDLNKISQTIIDYAQYNMDFIAESFSTCSNVVIIEYIIIRGEFDLSYTECVSGSVPRDELLPSSIPVANKHSIDGALAILKNMPPFRGGKRA